MQATIELMQHWLFICFLFCIKFDKKNICKKNKIYYSIGFPNRINYDYAMNKKNVIQTNSVFEAHLIYHNFVVV